MTNETDKRHDGSIGFLRVSPEQADLVVPLFLAYSEFYGQKASVERARAYLEDGLTQGSTRPVGFIQLHPSRSSQLLARRWMINDLYVLPEMRRERIGSKLLDMAKAFALTTGAKDLVLRTASNNVAARALYESQGWVTDDGFLTYRLCL
jgi:ribosomal protein S18 acetylase RimI-like enzyme